MNLKWKESFELKAFIIKRFNFNFFFTYLFSYFVNINISRLELQFTSRLFEMVQVCIRFLFLMMCVGFLVFFVLLYIVC